MPLYEYQCDACSRRFEVIQKYSDAHPESCPTCGGSVKRLFSSPAIQFKGSGWYITDYARAGKSDSSTTSEQKEKSGEPKSKSDGTSSASEGSGSSASESKTETTAPATPAAKPSE